MIVGINIRAFQHLTDISVSFDFSCVTLIRMTSKNGVGKTSIIS